MQEYLARGFGKNTSQSQINNEFINSNGHRRMGKQLILIVFLIFASNSHNVEANKNEHQPEYQAYRFTHLEWDEPLSNRTSIQLRPIQNFTGQPLQQSQNKYDLFRGKALPYSINSLVQNSLLSSKRILLKNKEADYKLDVILREYQPGRFYEASGLTKVNHEEWRNRSAKNSVLIEFILSANNKPIPTWIESINMPMYHCELNRYPQPLLDDLNQDSKAHKFSQNLFGQNILAALNYLTVKLINRLEQQPLVARVEKKFGNEIHLKSKSGFFSQGDIISIHFNKDKQKIDAYTAGKLQIIKTERNKAIAYPINLRGDHIKVGDWVQYYGMNGENNPTSKFKPRNWCGQKLIEKKLAAN